MNPTLLILAAGMGSRYGSLKQVEKFGPSGETIVEYSIFDALRAGFNKIVLVVRREFVDDFREIILKRAIKKAEISFVFQELNDLPDGFRVPEGRTKPWGTAHAVLTAEKEIKTPFAVINADDFYGADSFKIISSFLSEKQTGSLEEYCIVNYPLENTLSESGAVSRGICEVDNKGYLTDITEHKKIVRSDNKIIGISEDQHSVNFSGKEPVSMNMIGFLPSMFKHLRYQFTDFLNQNISDNKSEFYIPTALSHLIKSGRVRVKALHTNEKWFGVTYLEDREMVMQNISSLVSKGQYPKDLWK